MKTNKQQLDQVYTINVTEEMAQMIEKIAEYEQRKPRELLRILLAPILRERWVNIQKQEHPENTQPMEQPIFKG